jgi:regulator of sirC expression with transglutaminase-like and TPR domain
MDETTERFIKLVQGPEESIALDEAALLIAAHADPGIDIPAELRRIDELAAGAEASFDGWRRRLFGELGFTGDNETYDDPANSLLQEVVRRRTGIPISLSVLGMEVGRRLGVRLAGIGMPGHFLLRHLDQPVCYVDAFAGGELLDADGCRAVFTELHGPETPFPDDGLDPVGPLPIITRMLANLQAVYAEEGLGGELAWVLRLRLAIPGTGPEERTELAMALGAVGGFADAAGALESVAAEQAEDADELLREAHELRAKLN